MRESIKNVFAALFQEGKKRNSVNKAEIRRISKIKSLETEVLQTWWQGTSTVGARVCGSG
jgi:hypothetical protein